MKAKFTNLYIDIAKRVSELSYGQRLKVGAVIVKDHRILSYGYNGMPAGFDNSCEYEDDGVMVTKPEVIHAEINAIAKVARSTESCAGATMFITHSPCVDCAKMILQSGIYTVYYNTLYRNDGGRQLLSLGNVSVFKCE
jgi:dCMP deaminase